MTQEEKQLLLKDLCARLPYGVKCKFFYTENKKSACGISFLETEISFENAEWFLNHKDDFVDIKPYLRPMSSMTEEERREFSIFIGKTEVYVQQICLDADSMANPIIGGYECVYWGLFDRCIDWLNKNMFDYRGLIPMGHALEAKEGMYKTE